MSIETFLSSKEFLLTLLETFTLGIILFFLNRVARSKNSLLKSFFLVFIVEIVFILFTKHHTSIINSIDFTNKDFIANIKWYLLVFIVVMALNFIFPKLSLINKFALFFVISASISNLTMPLWLFPIVTLFFYGNNNDDDWYDWWLLYNSDTDCNNPFNHSTSCNYYQDDSLNCHNFYEDNSIFCDIDNDFNSFNDNF